MRLQGVLVGFFVSSLGVNAMGNAHSGGEGAELPQGGWSVAETPLDVF